MKKFRFAFGLLSIGALIFGSCVKQSYSNPPDLSTVDPHLPITLNIKDLVSPYWAVYSGKNRVIVGDSTISGIVVADDRTGNFYKQTIIQDSSNGINIAIDASNLYTKYPIGRRLYIKLKGLTIMNYNNSPELCYGIDNLQKPIGIPPILEDSFIVVGSVGNPVTPVELRMQDLLAGSNFKYANMLVKIDNMEIDSNCLNMPYAQPSGLAISTTRYVYSCINGTINGPVELYNSGFANFYNVIMPPGNGTLTAVFSLYSSHQQLVIRDTSDLNFTQSRCGH